MLIFNPCAGKETYCTDPCAGKEIYCTDPWAGKEIMALIHGREKGVIMDVLSTRLDKKWSRITAHKPWGL